MNVPIRGVGCADPTPSTMLTDKRRLGCCFCCRFFLFSFFFPPLGWGLGDKANVKQSSVTRCEWWANESMGVEQQGGGGGTYFQD